MTNRFILQEAPSFSSLPYYEGSHRFVFVGHNLLFSSRLYAVLKRQLSVVTFDVASKDSSSSCKPFSIDELLSLIIYRDAKTLILTSEVFLFCDYDFVVILAERLSQYSVEHGPLKVVFCKIDFPSPSYYSFNSGAFIEEVKAAYDLLQKLNKVFLAGSADLSRLVLSFSSYIPASANRLQENFLLSANNISRCIEVIRECFPADIQFYSCDDMSQLLLEYIYSEGTLSVQGSIDATSVSSFSLAVVNQCEIRSQLPTLSSNPNNSYTLPSPSLLSHSVFPSFPQTYCSLDVVYRNKPGTTPYYSNVDVASTRLRLGAQLSKCIPDHVAKRLDYICPVPETGKYYAQGLAEALEVPYMEALIKAKDIGRSFDIQDSSSRRDFIQNKLTVIPDILDGINVGIVDEAIFTGSTLKVVSEILAKTNVKSVFFFIPTPECTQRCPFNMQPNRNMLSEYTRREALSSYFDVDGVYFQDQSTFQAIIELDHGELCSLCFTSA